MFPTKECFEKYIEKDRSPFSPWEEWCLRSAPSRNGTLDLMRKGVDRHCRERIVVWNGECQNWTKRIKA